MREEGVATDAKLRSHPAVPRSYPQRVPVALGQTDHSLTRLGGVRTEVARREVDPFAVELGGGLLVNYMVML